MRTNSSTSINHSVILAGGKGTRLKPITYKIPKVMTTVNNKPFLQYVLEILSNNGFSRVLLLVGYLGAQIEEYFGRGEKFGLEIKYSYENTPLGTGGALKKAERLIAPEFLLVNGDTYLDFNYQTLRNKFKNADCKGLICVYTNKNREMIPNISLDKEGLITKYNKTNPEGLVEVDAGVGIFKKEVLNFIPENTSVSFENRVYEKLIQEKTLYGFPVDNAFLDIGTFEKLKYARRTLK